MRKHNVAFATRGHRRRGDTSNLPQQMTHAIVGSKQHQLFSNGLLGALFSRAKIAKHNEGAK